MTHVLAVVGPTASGKTSLAIELAERLGTEIISADSMQVYRGMEIGTAAPTREERARVKHHCVGFLEPGEHFSAGEFERQARSIIEDLNRRGKVAVVVGGSGLYIRALIDGLFPGPTKDDFIRERLREEAEEHGVAALYERLRQVDPKYAADIHPNDLRRIVRGLEVYELTHTPMSRLHGDHRARSKPVCALQVAIEYPRQALYERINARVDQMLAAGFVDEVRALLEKGYERHLLQLRSLGYREFIAHLRGECTCEEAAEAMKQNTRRFAKRQLTWFRADKRIIWLPATSGTPMAHWVEEVLLLLGCRPNEPHGSLTCDTRREC